MGKRVSRLLSGKTKRHFLGLYYEKVLARVRQISNVLNISPEGVYVPGMGTSPGTFQSFIHERGTFTFEHLEIIPCENDKISSPDFQFVLFPRQACKIIRLF